MLVSDIVTRARRILGDADKRRWTDLRMLDIVNSGIKDINKFAGAYRLDKFHELSQFRNRYPLPTDLLQITSVTYNSNEVPIRVTTDNNKGIFVTKDQLNIGVLEVRNIPVIDSREPRFKKGPSGNIIPQPEFDLWLGGLWRNQGLWRADQLWGVEYFSTSTSSLGVVSNPLLNPLGVASGATVSGILYADLPTTSFGLLTDVFLAGAPITVPVPSTGSTAGVLTNLDTSLATNDSLGSIGTLINAKHRIAGRYGTVVSVLKLDEYIHTKYRALPKELASLGIAFPLSVSWVEPMINWIVGTALQDDNDASNNQRANVFLARYTRELDKEMAMSSTDYAAGSEQFTTKYNGGIR